MSKKKKLSPKLQAWVDIRKKLNLSHASIQMARELGMKPKSLTKLGGHKQEPWKLPLPAYLSKLYEKRFGRPKPAEVRSIEAMVKAKAAKKAKKKLEKQERLEREAQVSETGESAGNDETVTTND